MKSKLDLWELPVTYQVLGQGEPCLFLHGHRADVEKWWVFVKRLAKDFKVFAPELPGMGGVTPAFENHSHTIRTYELFIVDFMKALNLKSVSLVGASLGGCISLYLLRDFPGYFQKGLFFWTPIDRSSYHIRKASYLLPLIRMIAKGELALNAWQVFVNSSLLHLFTRWDTPGFERREEILDDEMARWRSANLLAWSQSLVDLLTIRFKTKTPITVPAVTVFSSKDRYIDVASARQLFKQNFENLRILELETSGHVPKGKLTKSFADEYELAFLTFSNL